MSIREKLKRRHPVLPYDEWRRKLWRDFWRQMAFIASTWIAAGAFTVWLLSR